MHPKGKAAGSNHILQVRRSNAPKTDQVASPAGSKGDSTLSKEDHATREACLVIACDDQPDAREGQTGPSQVTERLVVPSKAGQCRWREEGRSSCSIID